MSLKFEKWFDVYNLDHIKAYKDLCEIGHWPEGFIPKGMELKPQWQVLIYIKMSKAWVEQVLAGKVVGMPPVD